MNLLFIAIPFILAILLGKFVIPYIMLITFKKRLFDPIDARKMHNTIIPRLGGVAFVPIQCCLLAITSVFVFKFGLIDLDIKTWVIMPTFIMLTCSLIILYLTGLADDLVGVSNKWKFAVQLFVAWLLVQSGVVVNDLYGLAFIEKVPLPTWFSLPFTMFIIVLIINAINLIDGLDGLCSGLVAVSCLVLGSLFAYYGAWFHALFSFVTLGVIIPFFYYNVFGTTKRRRRIFMGDTGSMTLGLSVAFLAVSFAMNSNEIKPFSEGAIVVAASTLIVPVFDVARVMFVRWYTKVPLFKPDRNHLHHKLLRAGLSHRAAMMSIIGLSLFYSVFNIIAVQYISNNIVIVLNFIIWILITLTFNSIANRRMKKIDQAEIYKQI